ncbi:MBL fold metallo-hydrolase [Chloroflexales bacterium ZM16-3]|nr:MBL fold metallo-hydrolase [Chloroflexales bacterium ZM16-3]
MPTITLAPDIIQVQLPLPFALRSVNCYLLRDPDGWTIIDAGLHTPDGEAAWRSAFDKLDIKPRDIRRIVLTHFHPDHYGMAGWLQSISDAPVLISPRDAEQTREVWEIPEGSPDPTLAHFDSHGVPTELTGTIVGVVESLREATLPHPELSLIAAGEQIAMGGRAFTAIHAPGHSDGQLIFFAEKDSLMLCGDHVLMKITPHIGWWPNSEPNPLGRYMDSIQSLEPLPVRLALSGHRQQIDDWAGRLRELREHHEERLEAMEEAVGESATAYEVATRVFPVERYTPHEIRFAVAETIAHLELLVVRGSMRRAEGEVIRYLQSM